MKFLFDLLPVLLFFIAFKLGGAYPEQSDALAQQALGMLIRDGRIPAGQAPILLATAVAILASIVQVGWVVARGRRVEPMLWISMVVIVVFGGATIWLHDEVFIKWKPTILYALFGGILVAARVVWRRNLIRSLLGARLALPDLQWDHLLWAWVAFFAALAALNLFVAYTFPTATWVNFKLFGLIGLTLVFALGVGIWLTRHIKEVPDA